jgi:hypothetical protein
MMIKDILVNVQKQNKTETGFHGTTLRENQQPGCMGDEGAKMKFQQRIR